MAVANYQDLYGSLPPAYVPGPDGTPWHSWRVLILPQMEHAALYNAYRFDEPWDGPHNSRLADKIGSIYLRSGLDPATRRMTSFVAVVGPETAWPGAKPLQREQIGDGPGNTLLVVEVPDGDIPWMAPVDLRFNAMSFRINDARGRALGSRLGGSRVTSVDNRVVNLYDDLPPAALRALLTANGHEPVNLEALPSGRRR